MFLGAEMMETVEEKIIGHFVGKKAPGTDKTSLMPMPPLSIVLGHVLCNFVVLWHCLSLTFSLEVKYIYIHIFLSSDLELAPS